ncbi:helix-turn-helix transcriptional regulator [Clostridioides difficile]|nr:helix-turn-helix transcriptional regulator [Clostridioides difficile]
MINEKLRKLRIKNNYTQQSIANSLGYKSKFTIYKKERGQRAWSVQDIQKLCSLYNVSPTFLLSDSAVGGENDAERKN